MSATQHSGPPIWPSGPHAAAHERLRGKVERCDGRLLVGWLLDPAEPATAVEFDLLVNGRLAGRHRADRARGDLKQKGIGTGRHGFRAPVPAALLVAGANAFRLVTSPGALEVEASFEIPAPPQPLVPAAVVPPAPAVPLPATPSRPPAAQPWPLPEPAAHPAVIPIEPPGVATTDGAAGLALGPVAEAGLSEMVAARAADRDWEAVLVLTEAAAADPAAEAGLLLARGRALTGLGQAGRAEPPLREVVRRDPANHAALFELGTALERQQRFAEAVEVFARCRKLAPRHGLYTLQAARAAALAANGGNGAAPERPELLPEAMALAREAMRLMPRDGRPCRELARLLHQVGDHEGALAAMEEAERRQPALAAFPLDRARILVRLDRVEEAASAAARAAELDPANDSAQFLQRVLERWSAARRAGPWRVVALTSLPDDPPAYIPAGQAMALPADGAGAA